MEYPPTHSGVMQALKAFETRFHERFDDLHARFDLLAHGPVPVRPLAKILPFRRTV